MNARAQLLTVLLFALVAVGVLAFSEPARSDDGPQTGVGGAASPERPRPPPPITYPGRRTSQTWIETPDGTRVAVGKGLEFRGVKVYLSLLWDLIGVDNKTGTVLYKKNVGAFWNRLGFKQVTLEDGKQVWAVELSPGARSQAAEKRQYHDLRTGKKLALAGPKALPSGKRLKPRLTWSGAHSRIPKAFHLLVSTPKQWETLTTQMFEAADRKRFTPVDFSKEVVLVVSRGDGWNCRGIGVEAVYEDDVRVLVRTDRQTFQTMNGAQQARPYGLFVLPRREKKAYVIERNRQGLIGGPPLWTESWRLERIKKPAGALADLPAASDVRHDAWEK